MRAPRLNPWSKVVIIWTICLLMALTGFFVDAATKDLSGTEALPYWWMAIAVFGLMAAAVLIVQKKL